MSANDEKFDVDNVSFSITELVIHNNRKIGYWIAVSGCVYDISKFISQNSNVQHILVDKSGTDITEDYEIIQSSISMYFIGRLRNPLQNDLFNEINKILYTCTRIENKMNIIIDSKNIDLYRICIYDTQNKLMAIFNDICLHINQIEKEMLIEITNRFQSLNATVISFINANACTEELLHIIYRYKGLCYFTKYTLENVLTCKSFEDTFGKKLSFLRKTIETTTKEFTNINKYVIRNHQMTILGGSLCGIVLAIYLKTKFSFDVHVYDKLDDPRIKYQEHSSASFNITISSRGFSALAEIGLEDSIREICLPIYGRCFHTNENDIVEQLYGLYDEALYVVKRDDLLCLLISEAEEKGIHLHYGVDCEIITYSNGPTQIQAVETLSGKLIEIHTDYLFGADGLNSKVRESIERQLPSDQKTEITKHKLIYRELVLPANQAGEYRFRNDRIHIWSRDQFIILAFPNVGGSFTLTLLTPDDHEKLEQFKNDPEFLCNFIEEHFSDISPFVTRLLLTEPQHRWGYFNQVTAQQWYLSDKVLILGDAAHAFYPFIGQGANCAFEDCRYLTQLIEKMPNDWSTIFSQFQQRKQDTDTIAKLATSHGKCLFDRINSQELIIKTKISQEITRQDPQIQPLYNYVSFTDVPYRLVPEMASTHEEILIEVNKCLEFNDESLNDQIITSTVADVIAIKMKFNE